MIVWLSSYPRSGNTFVRTLIHRCLSKDTYSIYNDRDIGGDEKLSDLTGHHELKHRVESRDFDIETQRDSSDVFFLKTHEPDRALVKKGDKVIYLLRDGRDAVVSYQRYLAEFRDKSVTVMDLVIGLEFPHCSWPEHVSNWSPGKFKDTQLIRFDELVSFPRKTMDRIVEFTGIDLVQYDIPSFAELHDINPRFFGIGAIGSHEKGFTSIDQKIFVLASFRELRNNGFAVDSSMFGADNSDDLLENLGDVIKCFSKSVRDSDSAAMFDIRSKKQRLRELTLRAEQQRSRIAELSRASSKLTMKLREVQFENKRLYEKNQQLNEKVSMLQARWSGRLTAPLRWIALLARRYLRYGRSSG